PLGAEGDFVTAPEISQMFGELIGVWLGDLWQRAGRPAAARYVELGPGRGTLATDALRAMRGAGLAPPVELVETSPVLRALQAEQLPARWHDDLSTLPLGGPLLIVANEFFDALPVSQFEGARELRVGVEAGRFVRDGAVETETSPPSLAMVAELARRLATQGGATLILDYGHDRPGTGDTLQAVSGHAFADPFEAPGSRDLAALLAGFTEEGWRREIADPGFAFRLAEDDGALAGYAKVAPLALPAETGRPAAELRQLYVLPPWHGGGIARELMDWVLAEARGRGAEELYLSVFIDNHRARSFYARYGFEEIGRYDFMVGRQADHDILMRARL